jgi:hypothetical protein
LLKLKRFRVTDFRSVRDSGWIEADQVGALIGTNESGKTNLLLPLWKLKPANDGEIDPIADFPRSDYTQLRGVSKDRVFIRAEFLTDQAAADALASLTGVPAEQFDVVAFARRYDGEYRTTFPNAGPQPSVPAAGVLAQLRDAKKKIERVSTEKPLRAAMLAALDDAIGSLKGVETANAATFKQVEQALAPVQSDNADEGSALASTWESLSEALAKSTAQITAPHPDTNEQAAQLALKHLPSFVYYSNYGNLDSEIYLPHVIANLERDGLGPKEAGKARTLKVLFEFVRLSPQEI